MPRRGHECRLLPPGRSDCANNLPSWRCHIAVNKANQTNAALSGYIVSRSNKRRYRAYLSVRCTAWHQVIHCRGFHVRQLVNRVADQQQSRSHLNHNLATKKVQAAKNSLSICTESSIPRVSHFLRIGQTYSTSSFTVAYVWHGPPRRAHA